MKNLKRLVKSAIGKASSMAFLPTRMTPDDARQKLQAYSPRPKGTCKTKNTVSLQYDGQIIIPAYNVEKYVQQCLDSVFQQVSDYKILVSIVDDGSTDGTHSILEKAVQRYNGGELPQNITLEVITQENKGFSGARNAALKRIKGNYIAFLDSDDVIPEDAIKVMLDAACAWDADILQGSWTTFSDAGKAYDVLAKDGAIKDGDGILSGYPWGKLYKYHVLENFQYPEGFLYEDTPLSFIIAAISHRTYAVKDIVYGYRQNPKGISATSPKLRRSIESYWITEECLREFPEFGVSYDQRAYEYLLRQSLMNANRARFHPRKIREAEFVLTSELMTTYFAEFFTQKPEMRKIEQTLRKRQFAKFEMLRMGM